MTPTRGTINNIMAKEFIGFDRSIVLEYDEDLVDPTNLKKAKQYVKKLQVTSPIEKEGFGIVTLEYDASYVSEDFEFLKTDAELKLPFATVEVYNGDMDEVFDDFTYNYMTLEIQI